MKKGRIIGLAAVLAILAWIIYSSMEIQAFSCEVCMEFNGQTQCSSGAGATREEATRTAISVACATLARGMEQSMRCEQIQPRSINCRER